ncbi:MAG: FHA domain-containing protein, partial [Chloroflexi bacterium]|nr:FHA domain-containing protein [Chloroflexota bacterium]
MAALIIQRAGQPDRERELGELALTIGREPDCELVIDDRSVSRHHARIEPAGDGHAIRDLESR